MCINQGIWVSLQAYGVKEPRAFAVVYTARARAISSVRNLRSGFPNTPIWARALDLRCHTPPSGLSPLAEQGRKDEHVHQNLPICSTTRTDFSALVQQK